MRTISVKQAYAKRFSKFEFSEEWQELMGNPEKNGGWIIQGKEKQGKTTFALILAEYLSHFEKVLYISAEEGISDNIIATMKRVGISEKNKSIKLHEYESFEDLQKRLEKRKCERIIFIDNFAVYRDEMTKTAVQKLLRDHPAKLFVFLSHEERNLPDTAVGRFWRKLSKIIVRVEGLKATITGRCPGGEYIINEEKAMMYHGLNL
ncbi:hypothetical protein [Riemerella columbipharyngis]|uniref:AAA+ ATPase domain-containing protein n=1 Tax=Riemerella columbipharyngis TaxID=1071918 RepID=A0A1G7A0W9_9FLAO|nr:hypothetical protein [Riemerella columbipharyngis]SDE08420.1 hypothetical protein SAMN05421544_1033 [Riemerella columbipharyngis]